MARVHRARRTANGFFTRYLRSEKRASAIMNFIQSTVFGRPEPNACPDDDLTPDYAAAERSYKFATA